MVKSYGLGSSGQEVVLLQRALNEKLRLDLTPDGEFGKITQDSLRSYQATNGITDSDAFGACYGANTQSILLPYIRQRFLTENDYISASQLLGVELAVVKAVTKTEAKKFGFLRTGFPVILFERHKFFYYLKTLKGAEFANKTTELRPDICNAQSGGYIGNLGEVNRLNAACAIHEQAALMSASYGLFQIMGFNYKTGGFSDVQTFVEAMKASERNQLNAFTSFILSDSRLLTALRKKDWVTVAVLFNGSGYAINQYDKKLAANYLASL